MNQTEKRRSPGEEYEERLQARSQARSRFETQEGWVANLRAVVFLVAAIVGIMAFNRQIALFWIIIPLAGFVVLVIVHVRLRRKIRQADRAVVFYERGMDRLDGRWTGKGEQGGKFADEGHPFAADLDLFGAGSLFERINTARTAGGEATLANWLKAPEPSAMVIRDRQAMVGDLAARLDLREDLDLLGDDVRVGLDPTALIAWGEMAPPLPDRRFLFVAIGLAALTTLALIGWFWIGTGLLPFFILVLVELGFWAWIKERSGRVLGPVDRRSSELALLAELLHRLEREEFVALGLKRLRESLTTGGETPSRQIARLARLIGRIESSRNQLIAPLSAIWLTGTRLAFAIEAWRAKSGPLIAGWISTVGTIEAYGSLGAYTFENPGDPFPEFVDDGLLFDAEAIGHPLIPPDRNVRNSIRLGDELRVLVVSGSNMSGKSTMLRTIGINAVLAMLGAPVRATNLRLSPFRLGATLRVQDSLQAGTSRFYAELTRLRQVVELAGTTTPLLFLLDEIFHGTNSDDRRVGAEGVVRGLIAKGAIGLVTTHDLALAAIAEGLAPSAMNVHFSDRFEEGSLVFDYTMKPGVVKHSNALALMRAVGLDV